MTTVKHSIYNKQFVMAGLWSRPANVVVSIFPDEYILKNVMCKG